MTPRYLPKLAVFLLLVAVVGCTGAAVEPVSRLTVTGQVRIVGNTPFQMPVLTTADNNSYVLIADDDVAIADLQTYRVTGRLYAAEWNGTRRAHLEVEQIVEVSGS